MTAQRTCEAVHATPDGDQHECGKPATHTAYWGPPIAFCDECLHDCMQDASPDEQATITKLVPHD